LVTLRERVKSKAAPASGGIADEGLTINRKELRPMAIRNHIPSIRPPQTSLAERLIQHAKTIRNPAAAAAMGDDMREAARIIEEWRVGIQEVIATTADDTTRVRLQKLLEG
jgi:hypothetical protein